MSEVPYLVIIPRFLYFKNTFRTMHLKLNSRLNYMVIIYHFILYVLYIVVLSIIHSPYFSSTAAELRVLYSPMMSDMAAQAMGSDPINVAEILEMLSNHLTVAECDVFGYLSIEGDLVILLYPVTASPTDLQVS